VEAETMTHPTRREFLKLGGQAATLAVGAAVGGRAVAAAGEPTLGLIFPPLNYPIPPDAKLLYPSGVTFIGNGVGLPGGMTIAGYEEAIPRVIPAAKELAAKGATVVSVFGSSITFYKGREFHENLMAQVSKATGLPTTTQSAGLLDGLKVVGAKRVALATAYTDEVTGRLKVFLEEYGYTVTAAKGLGFVSIPRGAATHEILLKLGQEAYAQSNRADAVVMSCGALDTLPVLVPLEGVVKVPVVSSTPHGLMAGVRLLGVNPKARGYGMVFERA
jgi:arylmalonate decarboxylase